MVKYPGAVEFLSIPVCQGYSWGNALIEEVAAGFFCNMQRIQSLGRLPILLTGVAWVQATYDMVARQQLNLAHNDPRLDPDAILFDSDLLMHKEFIRMKLQGEWFEKSKKDGESSGMDIGEDRLAYFTSDGNAELSEGLAAVHIGMITGMWTSFEVLAEELWNAAVTQRPNLNQGWTSSERRDSGFRSIKKLKNQYGYTFRQDAVDIQKTIGDERIEGLALTRNLLTHKLGKIDQEFDGRRKGNPIPLPCLSCFDAYSVGQQIKITGNIVQHLISPLPVLGLDLIHHVNQWIKCHP